MIGKPAFMIGATRSGGGKTTLTIGILAALVRRGMKVQCFKCGPDFIDPTLHETVTSTVSYNLDIRMMGGQCCRDTFERKCRDCDVAVVEGVMGLFDGAEASSAALAKLLDVPVFLVIDASSCAESSAAVLKGFVDFDPELRVCGAIFNRIGSARHRELIETAVRDRCRIGYLGFMPRDDAFVIPERHLGLHMGSEKPLDGHSLGRLTDSVETNLDLDLMLNTAVPSVSRPSEQPAAAASRPAVARRSEAKARIGVAMDEAFCFYYRQNFELLESCGFELVPFSPIRDEELPPLLEMLYFGGGYPENHAARLSANLRIRDQIRAFHADGRPIYGECGGFMYLCRTLTDMEGGCFPMAGVFPFDSALNKRLRRLGYRRVQLRAGCLLGDRGDILHGHEFHYSDIEIDQNGSLPDGVITLYRLDNNALEGYSVGSAVGSYIHLHFGGTPSALSHLYRKLVGTHGDSDDSA